MCKLLRIHPNGYYAWQASALSARAHDDQCVPELFHQFWLECGTIYGYSEIILDPHELREFCGKHRVSRLMNTDGLRPMTGYGRRPGGRAGKPSDVPPNHLHRKFVALEHNMVG